MRKKIEDLKREDLQILHDEWMNGRPNTFRFAQESVDEFFMGYYDYLAELASWDYPSLDSEQLEPYAELYDNIDNLDDYFWNRQDYGDWFQYEPEWTDQEREEYCRYWNGD